MSDTQNYADILANTKVTDSIQTVGLNEKFSLPTVGLPKEFVSFCRHIAERRNVPVEVTLLSALTSAGAVAGGYVTSRMGGYVNRPSLMTMIVAPSSTGKSQPLNDIKPPLDEIDTELTSRYKSELEAWRTANAKNSNPPTKPMKAQFICTATTDAGRLEFICDNERGGLQFKNELRAFFKNLSGKFNETAVENLLEISDGDGIKIHLKGNDELPKTKFSFLPVLGTIQNGVLRQTIRPDFIANGLLQRFCSVVIDGNSYEIAPESRDIEPTQVAWWGAAVRSLRSLGNTVWEFRPSAEGMRTYSEEHEKWRTAFKADPNSSDGYNDFKFQAYNKSLIAVHRLALICHLLKIAIYAPEYPHKHYDIEPDTIKWAFACVPYLVSQQMKVYELICGEPKQKPRTDRDIIRELAEMMKRKGQTLNQTALAELTGIARPNINQYLKGI